MIGPHQEKVSNIKPFINKYNCDTIKCASKTEGWKKFERNSLTIVLNALYK